MSEKKKKERKKIKAEKLKESDEWDKVPKETGGGEGLQRT